MKRLSLIFALALAAKLLTACGHQNSEPFQSHSDLPQGPMAAKTVVVRMNIDNPKQVEYVEMNNTPDRDGFQKFSEADHQWKALDDKRVISKEAGYPEAKPGSYFVKQPGDFAAPSSTPVAHLTSAYWLGTYNNCGYYNYFNYSGSYYGYNYYHYYPQFSYNSYANYNYQPTYYYNSSYWYYQPYAYYPAYNNYNYNYYIYTTWW